MVISNKRNKMVEFSLLDPGDVFILHNEDFCMKTESTYCDDNGDCYNAVDLANGALFFCNYDKMVLPVKCELVVE
jgi:hypothetical protein